MSMIPTLKLFSDGHNIAEIRGVVRSFHSMGGTLMFGTDTGFLPDYEMGEEYRQLSLAGLSWRDVLAMLTTNPARRMGAALYTGRVEDGMDADLTVLSVDPAAGDPAAFTHAAYTIRKGRVIFRSDGR